MRVTLAQIEAFYWIVRTGSFRDAARHLGRTQPSISLRIQELEQALGERVLERGSGRLKVTTAGTALLGYADRMLAVTRELDGVVRNGRLSRERIRLGSVDSFAMVCLPRLMREIARASPETHVEVTVDYSPNLQRRLDDNQFDACFIIRPEARPTLRVEPLCEVELVWVAGGARRARFGDGVFTPRDLADEPVFTLPLPAGKLIFGWFTDNGTEPTRVNLCNNLGIVVHLIRAGLGIGMVPRCLVRAELESGAVTEIRTDPRPPVDELEVAHPLPTPSCIGPVLREARAIIADLGAL